MQKTTIKKKIKMCNERTREEITEEQERAEGPDQENKIVILRQSDVEDGE